ncbi:ABC transporter permease [Fictibacillus sp. S7]|uniref:ABC transporter permease n=1 Tax=Fictibacillus sp. S7 TaxID=2212476 RepID=UPI001010D497|nr:ABC transporter permease [Fictibacillus sp. S7]RXZ02190.1 glutathione ABC transporter permease GsiC [Fictibacillus sp. S7]
MLSYAIKRILAIIPILIGVSFLVFSIVYLIPGDPAVKILGQAATDEAVAELRKDLGLDKPFIIQYGIWLGNMLTGDLGTSITMRVSVDSVLIPKLINTLILTGGSLVICLIGGVLIGLLAGLKPYSWFDRISMFFAQFGANVPVFWLAIVLMWIFSIQLDWLPAFGMYDMRTEGSIWSVLQHLILPSIAASSVSLAVMARLTRSSLIDAFNSDYVKTFRAYGISEQKIVFKHAFRNILSPIINMTGLQVGSLLGGALFVEVVFSWPGLGSQLYSSITGQDLPMVQAGVLFIAVSFVLVNLINDLLVASLNPRLRH